MSRYRVWAPDWPVAIDLDEDRVGPHHIDDLASDPALFVSEVEVRAYHVGLPVTVEVDDLGRVTVTTYLGEAEVAVADYDDGEPVAMIAGAVEQQVADSATVAAAIAAGNFTATTSKGA